MTETAQGYKLGVKVSGANDWTRIMQQATGGNNGKLRDAELVIGEAQGTVRVLKDRYGRTGVVTKAQAKRLLDQCETVHRFRL